MFVTCPQEIVPLLMQELAALGVREAKEGYCGVFVPQTMKNVYTINYRSRLATRVLWEVARFKCPDKQALYGRAKHIDWPSYLRLDQTFAIDSNVSHPNLRNSLFAAQLLKDALCDAFRDKTGERPSVNVANPDVQINLFIHQQTATISIDTSGAPLYKRGYRQEAGPAPLQESLAAAILFFAGYSSQDTLCDPFCGSGTFLVEAAMIASRTPAGFFRKKWGFLHHPEFSQEQWDQVKAAADAQKIPIPKGRLLGADKDPYAIKLCRPILRELDFHHDIELVCSDIKNYTPVNPTLVVSNPPYGKRIEASEQMYKSLGDFLKRNSSSLKKSCILTSEDSLARAIGLPVKKSIPLKNGGLPVELYTF